MPAALLLCTRGAIIQLLPPPRNCTHLSKVARFYVLYFSLFIAHFYTNTQKPHNSNIHLYTCSGGQQQPVLIAVWCECGNPTVEAFKVFLLSIITFFFFCDFFHYFFIWASFRFRFSIKKLHSQHAHNHDTFDFFDLACGTRLKLSAIVASVWLDGFDRALTNLLKPLLPGLGCWCFRFVARSGRSRTKAVNLPLLVHAV